MKRIAIATALLATAASVASQSRLPTPSSEVVGVGNFTHIVANLDAFIHFYHDVVGLELAAPARPWDNNPAILDLANAQGAQYRFVALKIPGSALGVEGVEYRDIDRAPVMPRFQDPGAANLVLEVRGLDSFLDRLRRADARFVNRAAVPMTVEIAAVKIRIVFVQDPDGFFVELIERVQALDTDARSSSDVLGGRFEAIVTDTDRTMRLYREALGLKPDGAGVFSGTGILLDALGTPGARFRRSTASIPGTSVRIAFLEFKDIERNPLRTRFRDPGTAVLQLRVRDAEKVRSALVAAGGEDLSTGRRAVSYGSAMRLALVRDPDNLFLELIQTP